MNLGKIGILITLFSLAMVQGYAPKGELATLTRTLQTLADALHKEEGNVNLTPETMARLKDFARRSGISDLNEALKLALSSAKSAKTEEPAPGLVACPVPPPPPPPAPPAPPIAVVKTGPSLSKLGKKKKEPMYTVPPSTEEILAGKKGLRRTESSRELSTSGEVALAYTSEKRQSDTLFLDSFRKAHSIAEVMKSLKALKRNPQYLKKESLNKQVKVTQRPNPLDVPILELLKKKSLLGIKQIYSDSPYLKKYLFNPDTFTVQDSELLNNLMQAEIGAQKLK